MQKTTRRTRNVQNNNRMKADDYKEMQNICRM